VINNVDARDHTSAAPRRDHGRDSPPGFVASPASGRGIGHIGSLGMSAGADDFGPLHLVAERPAELLRGSVLRTPPREESTASSIPGKRSARSSGTT